MSEDEIKCDDRAPTRPDYTLTELIHKYNGIKDSVEFFYELDRLYLNQKELGLLIEFFHCRELFVKGEQHE